MPTDFQITVFFSYFPYRGANGLEPMVFNHACEALGHEGDEFSPFLDIIILKISRRVPCHAYQFAKLLLALGNYFLMSFAECVWDLLPISAASY